VALLSQLALAAHLLAFRRLIDGIPLGLGSCEVGAVQAAGNTPRPTVELMHTLASQRYD